MRIDSTRRLVGSQEACTRPIHPITGRSRTETVLITLEGTLSTADLRVRPLAKEQGFRYASGLNSLTAGTTVGRFSQAGVTHALD